MAKNTKNIKGSEKGQKAKTSSVKRKRVTFSYKSKPGLSVSVAGDFNGWKSPDKPLKDKDGNGEYKVTMLLPQGTYEYKFFVEGKWCVDPENPNFKPNAHGTLNSVIKLV